MSETRQTPRVGRRRVLVGAWGAGLVLLAGETGAVLMKLAQPVVGEGAFGGVIRAGRVDEFAVGSVTYVRAGRFYLVRLDEGFLALWQTCTHLGCRVPWVEAEGRFHCPCHSSIFNMKGEVVGGPAPRPLDIFPTQIAGGDVFVDTSIPIKRTDFDPSQVTRV